jgi:hypothetical protein
MTVVLDDGRASGRIVVPERDRIPGEEGETGEIRFGGSYTVDEERRVVRFDHTTDTFVREVDWRIEGDRLVSATDPYRVTLERD